MVRADVETALDFGKRETFIVAEIQSSFCRRAPFDYFQSHKTFSDRLLVVLPADSSLAASLFATGDCILDFNQSRQRYCIPCKVRELKPGNAAREAAIWHNRVFNPALPDAVHVIAFKPDWTSAEG